jgi:opacity protein-like surface antigen
MFKKLGLIIAACLASGTAFAGDGNWTGWYIGAHGASTDNESSQAVSLGGEWADESAALRDFVTNNWSTELDAGGSAFGVQLGFDHQFDNNLVLGIEADYSWMNGDDVRATPQTATTPFPSLTYAFSNAVEVSNQWSLRPRLGVAFDDNLLYVTAGWTSVDVDAAAAIASNGGYLKAGGTSESLNGTVWGAGWEIKFADHWSARLEYLHRNVDDYEFDTVYLPGSTFQNPVYSESFRGDLDSSEIRIGVNYRF